MTHSTDDPVKGYAIPSTEEDGPIDAAQLFGPDDTDVGEAVIAAIAPILSKGLTQWFLDDSEIMLMSSVPESESACPLRFCLSFDVPRTNGSMFSRYFNVRDILLAAVANYDFDTPEVERIATALTTLADDMRVAALQHPAY